LDRTNHRRKKDKTHGRKTKILGCLSQKSNPEFEWQLTKVCSPFFSHKIVEDRGNRARPIFFRSLQKRRAEIWLCSKRRHAASSDAGVTRAKDEDATRAKDEDATRAQMKIEENLSPPQKKGQRRKASKMKLQGTGLALISDTLMARLVPGQPWLQRAGRPDRKKKKLNFLSV
jgi:hypothetical protein